MSDAHSALMGVIRTGEMCKTYKYFSVKYYYYYFKNGSKDPKG